VSGKNFIFKFFLIVFLLSLFEKDLFCVRKAVSPQRPAAAEGDVKKANDALTQADKAIERASELLKKFDDKRYEVESGFKDKNKELGELIKSVPGLLEKLDGGDDNSSQVDNASAGGDSG
jgi:hypothetical protein